MLTTDDRICLGDYAFKSSPESCSDNSYSTDYMDIASEEDFLTQLSSDLDIPLLLNPGEDEMSMLNSFFDKSPEEILSDIASPLSCSSNEVDVITNEINELQHLDFSQWGPEAFPNLASEVKVEEPDTCSSSDSVKSVSPVHVVSNNHFNSSILCNIKDEVVKPKSPPLSPNNCIINGKKGPTKFVYAQPVRLVPQIPVNNLSKLPPKRIAIQPKSPYTIPTKGNQVVVIKNRPVLANRNQVGGPKVVVLENIRRVPVKLPQVTNSAGTVIPSMIIDNNNRLFGIESSNIDPKILKRQQRKVKNRESACLSRKKKKDYLTSLEDQVKDLTTENQRLQAENHQLKERLSQYELTPKLHTTNKNIKQSIALCIFIFVVGVNMDFLRNPFSTNKNHVGIQRDMPKIPDHHSRSLLWTPEDKEDIKNKTSKFSPFTMCPAAINQTESARLVLELERWIGKPANSNSTASKVAKIPLAKRRKLKIDSTVMQSAYRINRLKNRVKTADFNNELQVFSPTAEQLYTEFFEAINRQDDTFYVVSFSSHQMLLPALHHNKTRRPKMSLIMPTILPNGTSPDVSKVQLMQIDCEVLDTRLLYINYRSIPEHLRSGGNGTDEKTPNNINISNAGTNSAGSYPKKPYKPYFINKNSLKRNGGFYNVN